MAKAENAPAPAAKKGGMSGLIVVVVVGVLACAGGFAVPLLWDSASHGFAARADHEAEGPAGKSVFVTFGEVVVNLAEERLTRYLRVKIILVVDGSQEKSVSALVQRNRAILKSWLISHLSDKNLSEVSGANGVNRLRREIQDQFNNLLFPDGSEKIRDILFEEFVVQ